MAKQAGKILAGVLTICICATLMAQQKKGGKPVASDKTGNGKTIPNKKLYSPDVFLGKSDFKGGKIPVAQFTSLMKQGLTAHDSLGNRFDILSFKFNYAERRVYEDTVGDLAMMVDLLTENCAGDSLPAHISESLYDRVKKGDTVFFDHVILVRPNGRRLSDTMLGRNMKCEITK